MPALRPFKGIRYNQSRIKDLSLVVAPPYDIIPEDMRSRLYAAHPLNIVRLILGRTKAGDTSKDNRYTRAGKFLGSWLDRGLLLKDQEDSLYIYSQEYIYDKKNIARVGFLGLMALDGDASGRKALPHENTLAAPKEDRLKLMKEVRSNLSPIFVLYDDRQKRVADILRKFCSKNKPVMDVYFDRARHRVWKLSDAAAIGMIKDIMRGKDIFIADGHHRYEVARTYSKMIQGSGLPEDVKEDARYIMVYFVDSDEKALTILPAHRLIKDTGRLKKEETVAKLGRFFILERMPGIKALMSRLAALRETHAFGMYLGGGLFYVLRLRNTRWSDAAIKDKPRDWKRLDVSILHLFILQRVLGIRDDDDNVEFLKSAEEAAFLVDRGGHRIAFFLNPTRASEVRRIARLGERMPRKATYFYPKPLSGLVINKFGRGNQ